jgi:hypothetical protein
VAKPTPAPKIGFPFPDLAPFINPLFRPQTIPRSVRNPNPFARPISPPGLTPINPAQLPLPRTASSPQNDYCKEQARKKRKKQRECKQRRNVVWASGPLKGRLAGTKCQEFE